MSVNHRIDGGAGEINNGDDEIEEGNKNKQKKSIGYGGKAKKVVLSRIKKAKKRLQRATIAEDRDSSSVSGGCCCCLYIRRIPTLDSGSESPPTSDPNCSEFGADSLRGLIEKNDFWLNECNTHLDVDDHDHDHD